MAAWSSRLLPLPLPLPLSSPLPFFLLSSISSMDDVVTIGYMDLTTHQ